MTDGTQARPADAAAAAADPLRRALLRLITRSTGPVTRDGAAEALGIPRATAAFHLDRLVEAGLLATSHARVNGRRGPGAGRPAKLYERAFTEVGLTIPERRYDLAGDLLTEAIETAGAGTVPLEAVVADVARRRGSRIGAEAGSLREALEATGFEPRDDEDAVVLVNCPFHRLATRHTRTICGMNVALVTGMADGAGEDPAQVCFAPGEDRCCVELRPAQPRPEA
ncbi:helix-turn-helix domain-containing protein [Amnibacterium sp. CER49]|uniref:helix-turn-helix transcriptional regulator n=1 Tax=Amnibacterium sp. CER49 TaxID=3039161 RepID=UPI00244B9DD6|nr:helix-turn-helix domain-containing protein [Amnibacterium sp. CER49]MDH2443367.1 helix-turn-helix domain-containing protein [Amnibacterium sp. CER49]